MREDRGFAAFLALVAVAVIANLVVWGVIIWAIVQLVQHFTK